MKHNKTTAAAELRRRAEEQLQNQTSSSSAPLSAHETQRLIQELQIHQIELEMQHEELRHSKAELEVSQQRFVDLYDQHAKEKEEKLESVNRQLQKAESLGRMAGAIAHHFNNKLFVVMGFLDLAIEELPQVFLGKPYDFDDLRGTVYRILLVKKA